MKKPITPAVFLIEGGKALELIREHIQEILRVRRDIKVLCDELGVEDICTERISGVLTRVVFKDKVHKDFTVADKRGTSRPKSGTEWCKRFDAQKGYRHSSAIIEKRLKVVTRLNVNTSHGSESWRNLGDLFYPCGFLFMSPDGPYAMYMPDLPRECEAIEAQGDTIINLPTRELQFEGCKRIEKEEWEIMVLQHKLAEKKG
jgi:hypothetical protein